MPVPPWCWWPSRTGDPHGGDRPWRAVEVIVVIVVPLPLSVILGRVLSISTRTAAGCQR